MTVLRKVLPAVLIAVPWTASMTVPMAAADPQQFPDLRGYNDVNSQDYRTYSAYSTIGPQFLTPGGYRCRMSCVSKASRSVIQCWGSLPDTSHNYVRLNYPGQDGAQFADKDASSMERFQWMDGPGNWHDGTVSPDAYKSLPPHSKVTYERETCGVDQHGFVLSTNGSWTF